MLFLVNKTQLFNSTSMQSNVHVRSEASGEGITIDQWCQRGVRGPTLDPKLNQRGHEMINRTGNWKIN